MANKSNVSLQKGTKRVKMRTRILVFILLVVIFQLLTCAAVLIFGGEFGEIREYSYRALAEKAENSGAYMQRELQERSVIAQEHARQLDSAVAEILAERGVSIADLRTDGELRDSIIQSSADIVSDLLRRSGADDAYLILDTGDLDADAKSALYLCAGDPNFTWENSDQTVDSANLDFYEKALQTARENRGVAQNDLGYWSGFSQVTSALTPSMKYSLPLMAEDGTVYGVVGIGLTQSNLLSAIPSPGETACYVLGRVASDSVFEIQAHSGSAYSTLLGDANALYISGTEDEGICRFNGDSGVDLVGSVQDMELYATSSPYAQERWALICVADRSSVLRPLLSLRQMLAVSAVLSLIVAAIVATLGANVIIKPLSNLSQRIKAKRKYNEVIRFEPSNIYEIDEITDAITQLQINVQDFSSQVSKMIAIADVGLGTFMYDRTDDSVFVGQSLIRVLNLDLPKGEDIVMSRHEFLNSIGNPEVQALITEGLNMKSGQPREDFREVHQINRRSGGTLWLRLGYTYSPTTAIGIVQDVTNTMITKARIEHERDYDTLTDLLTRHAYYRRLQERFRDKEGLKITAFIMIDLDNLKYVNDTYGHGFGDTYIKTAAKVLKKFQNHGGIVARLSGDEFNICLPGFSSKEEIWEIIKPIRAELLQSSCLLADGTHYKIGASMGVSWYPDDADSYELLMKYADFAMYTVKHSTKGGIAEFDIHSYITDSARLADLEELNHIIEESRVRYAFQRIICAKTGKTYGYEALMRVQSEVFRSPMELLNTARASAKLHEIERLTWTKSLADFQALVDAGKIEKDARLFVNSIANHKLDEDVLAELENTYPDLLGRIVIEILENESADEGSTAHKEQVMYRWGGQIALDDYGTGYNSEYALLNLHPNIIKIDRSIISGCDQDPDRRMIIENLVKLAKAKKVLVLAEGVETKEELETVISCGVDFLQGFYLAHPVFEPGPIAPESADLIHHLADPATASTTND